MADRVYCVLDYETYSETNLKKVGAYEYSVDRSTEVLCAAWRVGTRDTLRTTKTHSWNPRLSKKAPAFFDLIRDHPEIIIVAHNAYFEQVITRNVLGICNAPPSRWLCTASHAATLALPRNLEGAAEVLKLSTQKDMEGRRLILKWCKPRKPSKKNPKTRHDDPEELERIVQYCKTDVDTEVELFLNTPMLTPTERKVWKLDQEINLRGFMVDRPLVGTVLQMISKETVEINRKTKELTDGKVLSTTQRQRVLDFIEARDVYLPDLKKGTIEDAFEAGLIKDEVAKELLGYRLAIAKTSTAKYEVMELCSRTDSRIRDSLLYHTASTGRWGGMKVQPQNLPRASIKDTNQAAEILATGDLELVRLIYGEPMNTFSDCIRSAIIAPKGKTLDVADYAAIEARVLFWVADHEDGLRAFREGRDLYKEQAAAVFNKRLEDILKDSTERFVGKTLILACGFGQGAPRFIQYCADQGVEISEELGKRAITAYRTTHSPVVKLWRSLEMVAKAAIENPGKRYSINHTRWWVSDKFLWCELPSGRRLAYFGATIRYEINKFKAKVPVIYHWGVHPITKKWVEAKTWGGTLVENVVQGIARDLMAAAMLRIADCAPWEIVLSVHDELIAERDLQSSVTNQDFCNLMAFVPSWAPGLPVSVAGWSGPRYKK